MQFSITSLFILDIYGIMKEYSESVLLALRSLKMKKSQTVEDYSNLSQCVLSVFRKHIEYIFSLVPDTSTATEAT